MHMRFKLEVVNTGSTGEKIITFTETDAGKLQVHTQQIYQGKYCTLELIEGLYRPEFKGTLKDTIKTMFPTKHHSVLDLCLQTDNKKPYEVKVFPLLATADSEFKPLHITVEFMLKPFLNRNLIAEHQLDAISTHIQNEIGRHDSLYSRSLSGEIGGESKEYNKIMQQEEDEELALTPPLSPIEQPSEKSKEDNNIMQQEEDEELIPAPPLSPTKQPFEKPKAYIRAQFFEIFGYDLLDVPQSSSNTNNTSFVP